MSAFDGFGEIEGDRRRSLRQPNGVRAEFIGTTDLTILSSALAQYINNAGRHAREEPERNEVIRAREMMDYVDDALYAISPTR